MKLFSKPAAIIDEIGKMRTAENFRREDRAIISNFFNGGSPLTDAEAEELGFTVNTNHLFGFKDLSDARDQMFSFYTKPARLVEIDLDAAPPGKREDWRLGAQEEASRVLKKITAFKNAYQGISGDGALHGEAVLFYPNRTFPLPKQCPLSKLLVPDDTPADVTELTHFAIESELSLRDLHWYTTHDAPDWNKGNLRKVLNAIYEDCLEDGREIDATNLEEAEYRRQENSATPNSRRRPGSDVYYFYQQRPDKFGCPYDCTIILRTPPDEEQKEASTRSVLYESEDAYGNIHECMHAFFMDCIIGGAPKWHRVLGLGALNYQINHAVELLICRLQQATVEGSMNLWVAKDVTTRDAAQQILLKHNGVIPEGLSLLQNRFEPNFKGILESIQFFRQQGSRNAQSQTSNTGDQNDQLEVQFLAEQNQGASSVNNRTSNWQDYMDVMYTEAVARLANPYIEPDEHGYSEAMDFQGAMERRNIPLAYLQRGNILVKATRVVGDGVRQKELAAAQYLTQNRAQFAPEMQPRITRMVTGIVLDNAKLAEDLTPITEEPDSPQLLRADSENAIMLTQRKPLPAKADDVDELHVKQHFPALETLISDGLKFQKGSFVPPQAESFKVIGAHIVVHVQRMEGKAENNRNDPERDKARQFMDQLNQYAAMAEKLIHNMDQQQQGAEQEEMTPLEQAQLQLKMEQLKLAREKMEFSAEKFQRIQGNKEQALAFEQMLKLENDRRTDQESRHMRVLKDVEVATKVAVANRPQPAAK